MKKSLFKKYDFSDYNIIWKKISIKTISYLSISFEGDPIIVQNDGGEEVIGNNFNYNNKLLTVKNPIRNYTFDNLITFNKNDSIKNLGVVDSQITNIPILVDFFYFNGIWNSSFYNGKLLKI